MDLHLGTAVAERRSRLADVCGDVAGPEQTPVQLRRRDVADHGAAGTDHLTAGRADAGGPPTCGEDALDIRFAAAGAAVVLDQPHERVDEPRAAAARDRHAPGLDRDARSRGS